MTIDEARELRAGDWVWIAFVGAVRHAQVEQDVEPNHWMVTTVKPHHACNASVLFHDETEAQRYAVLRALGAP